MSACRSRELRFIPDRCVLGVIPSQAMAFFSLLFQYTSGFLWETWGPNVGQVGFTSKQFPRLRIVAVIVLQPQAPLFLVKKSGILCEKLILRMPMCFWFFSQVSGHLRGSPESNFLFNHRHKISCAFFAGQNTCAFIWRNSPICQYSKLKNKNCIQSLKHISLFHIFFCMHVHLCSSFFRFSVFFSLFLGN